MDRAEGKNGKKSVYENVRDRLRRDIELGVIADGERLPSCRALAMDMGINPNTVQRAYASLESEGVIDVVPQKGAYARRKGAPAAETDRELTDAMRALRDAGFTRAEIETAADKVFGGGKNGENGEKGGAI